MDELISIFANASPSNKGMMIALALMVPLSIVTLLGLNAAFKQMGINNAYVRVVLSIVVGSFIVPFVQILCMQIVPVPAYIEVLEVWANVLGYDFDWEDRLRPILTGLGLFLAFMVCAIIARKLLRSYYKKKEEVS